MRSRWLSLSFLFLTSAVLFAQQPGAQTPQIPQQSPPDPNDKLDAILLNWEKAMSGMTSLDAQVKRTAIDKVLMTTEVYSGRAKYLKPNKASLWLQNENPKKQQEFERLVCNGQIAYKWEPAQKEIHIHELPKPKQGQINDDNFVSMLFGMKAEDAKRRYDMQVLTPRTNDTYYYYIQVLPRDAQDKAEFTRARLVLRTSNNLPYEIWFEQPNGNEVKWEFPRIAPNAQIDPREFGQPTPPGGWQLKRVALPEGPRVIRPQQ